MTHEKEKEFEQKYYEYEKSMSDWMAMLRPDGMCEGEAEMIADDLSAYLLYE